MQKTLSKPHISVVIPALNEQEFLPLALESLYRQTHGNFEVIVVDNNSTDATAAVAASFGARVVIESRRGVCFARQRGVEAARGEIIISTDADCMFASDWLERISQAFRQNSDVVAVTGAFEFMGPPVWGTRLSRFLFWMVHSMHRRFGKIIYVGASNFAFRKSAWEQVGGYNVNLAQGGDEYDLLRRFRQLGGTIYLHSNNVYTSSRRLYRGFLYSTVITLGVYYFFDYMIASRFTGKTVLGHYEAVRNPYNSRGVWSRLGYNSAIFALVLMLFSLSAGFRTEEVEARSAAITGATQLREAVSVNMQNYRVGLHSAWHRMHMRDSD